MGDHPEVVEGLPARRLRSEIRSLTAELGESARPQHYRKSVQALKAAALEDDLLMETACWMLHLSELYSELQHCERVRRQRAELRDIEPQPLAPTTPAHPKSIVDQHRRPPPGVELVATLTRCPAAPPAGLVPRVRPWRTAA